MIVNASRDRLAGGRHARSAGVRATANRACPVRPVACRRPRVPGMALVVRCSSSALLILSKMRGLAGERAALGTSRRRRRPPSASGRARRSRPTVRSRKPASSSAATIWSRPRISTPRSPLPRAFPAPGSVRSRSGRSGFIIDGEGTRHSGAMRSIEPGISRFRVRVFDAPRNDGGEKNQRSPLKPCAGYG